MKPVIEVLDFEGCPHADAAWDLVREVASSLAPHFEAIRIHVASDDEARRLGFPGSPTIRVNGRDLEDCEAQSAGLTCRIYEGGRGVPPRWLVEAAILRALQPKGLLFLCVQNSARSQMAEGIARSLAAGGVHVFSAGSSPSSVRPEAIQVCAEIGVDLSGHRSKHLSEVPADLVDAVVTLCAEEVCPVWAQGGRVPRVHWGLPDPAATQGPGRLQAFREVRDELHKRLAVLFARAPGGAGGTP